MELTMRFVTVVICLLLLAACGDRDDRFDSWEGLEGPQVVGEQVVYVDHNFDEALVLEIKAGEARPAWKRYAVEADSSVVGRLEQRGELLLQSSATGVLTRFNPASGATVEYPLDAPFDRYVVLQDPPFAGAYYSDNAGDSSTLFLNQGEVAFVDLNKNKDAVSRFVLKTYGGAPLGLDIAPRVPAAGGGRMFAFVRWNSFLSLVDAEQADFQPIAIPLKAPDTEAEVSPGKLQYVAGNNRLSGYFLAQASQDLYAIDLDVKQMTGGASGVTVNVFPTAAGASTFTTFSHADGDTGILVLSPNNRMVAVVHPESSAVKLYSLEGLTPTAVTVFTALSPETGVEEEFAFIYNDSGSSKSYYYVELHRIAEKKSKAFHRYTTLPAAVRKVYMQPDDSFLVMHSTGSSPFSFVTVSNGSVESVGGGLTVSNEIFSPDGKTMYALSQKGGKTFVVAYDLESRTARTIDVSYGNPPVALVHMADAGLLVAHDSSGQTLTVIPEDFDSDAADSVVQFFAPTLFGLEH
jgi:hypothetical protein